MSTIQWRNQCNYPAQWSVDGDNRMSIDINYRAFPVIKLVLTSVAGFDSPDAHTGICEAHSKAHVEFEHHEQRSTLFDPCEHAEFNEIPERVGRVLAYAILTCDNIDPKRIPDWGREPTAKFLEAHRDRIDKVIMRLGNDQ